MDIERYFERSRARRVAFVLLLLGSLLAYWLCPAGVFQTSLSEVTAGSLLRTIAAAIVATAAVVIAAIRIPGIVVLLVGSIGVYFLWPTGILDSKLAAISLVALLRAIGAILLAFGTMLLAAMAGLWSALGD